MATIVVRHRSDSSTCHLISTRSSVERRITGECLPRPNDPECVHVRDHVGEHWIARRGKDGKFYSTAYRR